MLECLWLCVMLLLQLTHNNLDHLGPVAMIQFQVNNSNVSSSYDFNLELIMLLLTLLTIQMLKCRH